MLLTLLHLFGAPRPKDPRTHKDLPFGADRESRLMLLILLMTRP